MSALGYFTPAKEEERRWMPLEPSRRPTPSSTLSGEEAKRFYQSLVEERTEETKTKREGEERRRGDRERRGEQRRRENYRGRGDGGGGGVAVQANRPVANAATELDGFKLLRCAQEGDLPGVRALLDRGVDINFQDNFFWTALMCASREGQRGAVRQLLQRGAAWVGVVDTQGRDAKELAQRAGHWGVVEELEGHGRPAQDHRDRSSAPAPSQWCSACGSHYSGGRESHLSSTLHQFSSRRAAPPPPHYCLPPSSTGYRMMLRSGWDPEGGLGPAGGGPKQPVRTVLKRDQRGLGYGPPKRPRVTHFQALDPQAVKRPGKEREGAREMREGGMRKEESRRKEAMDRTWERDFRNSFYQ